MEYVSEESLQNLWDVRRALGPAFGSEDLCMLLYALVRRERPNLILELGTGLGVCTLWIARALQENRLGHIYTVDDWRSSEGSLRYLEDIRQHFPGWLTHTTDDLGQFVRALAQKCEVESRITFETGSFDLVNGSLPTIVNGIGKLDVIFSDFNHRPETIFALFRTMLPLMSEYCSIFIDSAPTFERSFLILGQLVEDLNRNKLPLPFCENMSESEQDVLSKIIARRRFQLISLVERRDRPQNSTAWVRIEPVDYRPFPKAKMR